MSPFNLLYALLQEITPVPSWTAFLQLNLGKTGSTIAGGLSPAAAPSALAFELAQSLERQGLTNLGVHDFWLALITAFPNQEDRIEEVWRAYDPCGGRICIHLWFSSPAGAVPLNLTTEQERIEAAVAGSRYFVEVAPSATTATLVQALTGSRRRCIWHFSGHGLRPGDTVSALPGSTRVLLPPGADTIEEEHLVLVGPSGGPHLLSRTRFEALARTAQELGNPPQLVVLNACWLDAIAAPLLQHVPELIGMTDKIQDAAAIEYADMFYQALVRKETCARAHTLSALKLSLDGSEQGLVPQHRLAAGEVSKQPGCR